MRKLLKEYGFVPDKLVTDELRSYAAAAGHLGIAKLTSPVNGATTEPRTRINLETAVGWFGFDENRALSLA